MNDSAQSLALVLSINKGKAKLNKYVQIFRNFK